MTEYRPLFQTQLDDTLGPWVNCGLNAIGMATDKDSLGLVRPDASTLRRYLLPDTDGVTQTQALEALEQVYGWTLASRDVAPEALAELLTEQRGALVNVVRQPLGDFCGSSFGGTHGIYVQEKRDNDALLFDPLCNLPRWMDWNRLVLGGLAFGQLVGISGRIRVALTRPARVEPKVERQGLVLALHRHGRRHHRAPQAQDGRLLGQDGHPDAPPLAGQRGADAGQGAGHGVGVPRLVPGARQQHGQVRRRAVMPQADTSSSGSPSRRGHRRHVAAGPCWSCPATRRAGANFGLLDPWRSAPRSASPLALAGDARRARAGPAAAGQRTGSLREDKAGR